MQHFSVIANLGNAERFQTIFLGGHSFDHTPTIAHVKLQPLKPCLGLPLNLFRSFSVHVLGKFSNLTESDVRSYLRRKCNNAATALKKTGSAIMQAPSHSAESPSHSAQ